MQHLLTNLDQSFARLGVALLAVIFSIGRKHLEQVNGSASCSITSSAVAHPYQAAQPVEVGCQYRRFRRVLLVLETTIQMSVYLRKQVVIATLPPDPRVINAVNQGRTPRQLANRFWRYPQPLPAGRSRQVQQIAR